jgi:hypothetical protein
VPAGVVAIDGKTVCRSGTQAGKDAIHMVPAFAARQRLVPGQVKVAEKSNEIVAIPKLLGMLAVEGRSLRSKRWGVSAPSHKRSLGRRPIMWSV